MSKLIRLNTFILIAIIITTFMACGKNEKTLEETHLNIFNSSKNLFKTTLVGDTSKMNILPGIENKGQNIFGIRLYDSNGTFVPQQNFYLKEQESWENFISVVNLNTINKSDTYKLLLLIDYKQNDYYVDGKNVDTFTFKMDNNSVLDIPVKIQDLSYGMHDVIFIFIRNPDNKLLNNLDMKDLNFLRCTITVGNGGIPKYNLTQFTQTSLKEYHYPIYMKYIMEKTPWECKPGTSLYYNINIENNGTNSHKYAVVAFLDWKQIPLNKNDESIIIELKDKSTITVPSVLNVPKEESLHSLRTILVLDPYEKLDYKNNDIFNSLPNTFLDVKK